MDANITHAIYFHRFVLFSYLVACFCSTLLIFHCGIHSVSRKKKRKIAHRKKNHSVKPYPCCCWTYAFSNSFFQMNIYGSSDHRSSSYVQIRLCSKLEHNIDRRTFSFLSLFFWLLFLIAPNIEKETVESVLVNSLVIFFLNFFFAFLFSVFAARFHFDADVADSI